jgi:hypothetical protein
MTKSEALYPFGQEVNPLDVPGGPAGPISPFGPGGPGSPLGPISPFGPSRPSVSFWTRWASFPFQTIAYAYRHCLRRFRRCLTQCCGC